MIFTGLKRPVSEPAETGVAAGSAGSAGGQADPARRLASIGAGVAGAVRAWPRSLADWAAGRAVAPNSVTGISLLLALCAAAWFSGGTASDNLSGTVALAGWWLSRGVARRMAVAPARSGFGGTASGPARSSTDWLVLPGFTWSDGDVADLPDIAVGGDSERRFNWLAVSCSTAAECAMYGGIAAGGAAAGWAGMWPLAVATITCVSVAETVSACCPAGAAGAPGNVRAHVPDEVWGRVLTWFARIRRPSAGLRVLVAGLGLAVHGPRVALVSVLAVPVLSACLAVASRAARRGHASGAPADGDCLADQARLNVVLASRDDGAVARWAGRLVQGNLAPLPPAVAAIIALTMLASLGMGKLPGVIALAPIMAMLLAAPGSSHPHDGRVDWLVPALLCAGQYLYLAALGFAWSVPGPVIFAACSLTAIWHASLAGSAPAAAEAPADRKEQVARIISRPADGIGWEARMFAVAIAGMLGLAAFGYLGVTAYLGVLIGRKAVAGSLLPTEDVRQ
ncbi:MAG TPA: hypothetical protein VNF47_11040 [Streptosporangiaceae bacterium]|nr:hypothetical protein [Streptosporangiaceae bacterium]